MHRAQELQDAQNLLQERLASAETLAAGLRASLDAAEQVRCCSSAARGVCKADRLHSLPAVRNKACKAEAPRDRLSMERLASVACALYAHAQCAVSGW